MPTRAQIGIYEGCEITDNPVVLIYRHNDGYPTGQGGVVPLLSLLVPEIITQRGTYDAEYLAAGLVHRFLNDDGDGYPGYGINNRFKVDIRFYYAITARGVTVFDAREVNDLDEIMDQKPMFFTAWEDPERLRHLENEVTELERKLSTKQVELRGLRRKHL